MGIHLMPVFQFQYRSSLNLLFDGFRSFLKQNSVCLKITVSAFELKIVPEHRPSAEYGIDSEFSSYGLITESARVFQK